MIRFWPLIYREDPDARPIVTLPLLQRSCLRPSLQPPTDRQAPASGPTIGA
jgi:hypothetical protein